MSELAPIVIDGTKCGANGCTRAAVVVEEIRFGKYGIGPVIFPACDEHRHSTPDRRTPEEEYDRRFDRDMAAREGELRDLAAEREEDECR